MKTLKSHEIQIKSPLGRIYSTDLDAEFQFVASSTSVFLHLSAYPRYLHLCTLKLFPTLEITCKHRRNLATNLEKKRSQTEYYFQYLQNTDWLRAAAMWVRIDVQLTGTTPDILAYILFISDLFPHKNVA